MARVRRSLALVPDRADWHSNLGIMLQGRGDAEGAIEAYERAIVLDPRHANAHSNLGVLFRAQRRNVEAEAAYRAAIALDPRHADAYQNLAVLLSATGRVPEAVTCYCTALTLRPDYAEARRLLALAYCVIDQRDKAVLLCEEWVRQEPDDPVARHTLAACSGRDVPARASDGYVEETFDTFARTFEAKLAQLQYQAPALVAGAVADAGVRPARALDVLDAGCGTGLCGPLLAPYARRLVGVDLSNGMLQHAQEKGVYDELCKVELTGYLHEHAGAFDLVVSADTLVYFGALDEVAQGAARALRDGGLFVFTLEASAGDDGAFDLQPHGRYTHRTEYVTRVLAEAGLDPDIGRADLRLERGLPVPGLVVRAVKRAPAAGGARG
jgi:predicted TPR repeat methyltransferase